MVLSEISNFISDGITYSVDKRTTYNLNENIDIAICSLKKTKHPIARVFIDIESQYVIQFNFGGKEYYTSVLDRDIIKKFRALLKDTAGDGEDKLLSVFKQMFGSAFIYGKECTHINYTHVYRFDSHGSRICSRTRQKFSISEVIENLSQRVFGEKNEEQTKPKTGERPAVPQIASTSVSSLSSNANAIIQQPKESWFGWIVSQAKRHPFLSLALGATLTIGGIAVLRYFVRKGETTEQVANEEPLLDMLPDKKPPCKQPILPNFSEKEAVEEEDFGSSEDSILDGISNDDGNPIEYDLIKVDQKAEEITCPDAIDSKFARPSKEMLTKERNSILSELQQSITAYRLPRQKNGQLASPIRELLRLLSTMETSKNPQTVLALMLETARRHGLENLLDNNKKQLNRLVELSNIARL